MLSKVFGYRNTPKYPRMLAVPTTWNPVELILKNLGVQISPLVTKLFNKYLVSGNILSNWSKENVTPLFKVFTLQLPTHFPDMCVL